MLATAIIVFREVLEAALVIGIVLAASREVRSRGLWVAAGATAGALGALAVAGFADAIAASLKGVGQEVFNAAILFSAVAMLGWHCVWMSRHGRSVAAEAGRMGRAVLDGSQPLYVLAVIAGLAVLREGSEIVLFLYGIALAGGSGGMALGGLLGLAAGAMAGAAIYLGLLAIPVQRLFAVTTWLILLLAAGMASQGAAFLVQADLLPALGNSLWSTARWLSEGSALGQVLHALVGYTAEPAGIQLIFYGGTVLGLGVLMRLFGRPRPQDERPGRGSSAVVRRPAEDAA